MMNDKKTSYVTRDSILKLLSDDEVATVSTAETAASLAVGDEYVDLGELEHGVRTATGTAVPMGRALPKKAVRAETWTKIVSQLSTSKRTN